MFEPVLEVFSATLKDCPPAQQWLLGALSHHAGQHLSICLSIELSTKLIAPVDVSRLIASTVIATDIPAMFSVAIQKDIDLPRLLGAQTPRMPSPSADAYVRVIKLNTFVSHCLGARYSTDGPDLAEAQDAYFPNSFADLESGTGLSYVTQWTTPKNILWVASYAELSQAVEAVPNNMGSTANDSLGLAHVNRGDDRPILIGIKYPVAHPVEAFKPTVYLADWSAQKIYYLSAADDPSWIGWGCTRSCTGRTKELHERVHNGLPGLTDEFVGGVLGPIDDVGDLDYQSLIQEGLRRLEIATKGYPGGAR